MIGVDVCVCVYIYIYMPTHIHEHISLESLSAQLRELQEAQLANAPSDHLTINAGNTVLLLLFDVSFVFIVPW